MITINGNEYRLVLLDTNILQKLATDTLFSKRLFERFFLHSPISIFCFTFDNVVELMNKRQQGNGLIDIYASFLKTFSRIPCFMFSPYKSLLQEEKYAAIQQSPLKLNNRIAYAFTPDNDQLEYNFENWLKTIFALQDGSLVKTIQDELAEMPETAHEWMKQRSPHPLSASKLEEIHKQQEERVILSHLLQKGIDCNNIDYRKFPAARTMLFSQVHRVHLTKKHLKNNDVMDVLISAYAPYVDTVITEAYQADVYKKAQKIIPELKSLEILTIRDI